MPIIDYLDIVYQNTTETCLRPLYVPFNSLCRFILRCPFRTHHCHMYNQLQLLPLNSRRKFHWLQFIFKCIYFNYPQYLKVYFVPRDSPYPLRRHQNLCFNVPKINREMGHKSFAFKAPSDRNSLPPLLGPSPLFIPSSLQYSLF